MTEPHQGRAPIVHFVEALDAFAARLRHGGLTLLLLMVTSIALLVISRVSYEPTYFEARITRQLSITFAIAGLVGTAGWEYVRKRGRAIADELTDEVQEAWFTRLDEDSPGTQLEWRVAIRNFGSSADLPLVPGPFGPTIYASLFIAAALFGALVWN